MPNAAITEPRAPADVQAAGKAREVDRKQVEHREPQHDEQQRDAEIEPRRRVDRSKRAGCENDDQTEHAVDERHRRAVHSAEQEAPPAGPGPGAGADDGQVDRNHRQHARREVQREPADEDEQQDRQRPATLEEPAPPDAVFRVADMLEEVVRPQIAAEVRPAEDVEFVEGGVDAGRTRRLVRESAGFRRLPRIQAATTGAAAGASPSPNAMRSKTSARCGGPSALAGTIRSVHSVTAVLGAKQTVSLQA